MDGQLRERHGVITRLYLELTGYPQVGDADLYIAHAPTAEH